MSKFFETLKCCRCETKFIFPCHKVYCLHENDLCEKCDACVRNKLCHTCIFLKYCGGCFEYVNEYLDNNQKCSNCSNNI